MTTDTGKVTITVRLIRSFDHRIIKHVVYHDVCLEQKVSDFKQFIKTELKTHSGLPPPFKTHNYDSMKISHQPFGAKTSDPVINKENDEQLMLTDDKTLEGCGVVNETELSFFNLEEYRAYQKNPTLNW
ncbi:UPF0538 protein C2orf76-like [Mercenaria mercenaria]|uniref:UPF0538 protein C2orf76-like n=1 Tax=Mercenaria mercenaria TaxID=6596 RepID=UPI00234F593B|nr:UPF0538 protein C2orf76-like [Mercenaria mercenaria]XP_053390428.1 UPF0538 protein C2orf76-like [Mercenaria mercenaria]